MPITNIDITDQDHETRITTNESSITTLNGTVSGHTSQISTLNSNYTTLSTTVSGLSVTVASHTISLSGIDSTLTSLNTRTNDLEADVSTLQTTVSGHTTAISNLETSLDQVGINTTGFENQTDSMYSFVEATRIFTIQPVASEYNIFQDGVKYAITNTKSVTIPNVTSPYFIYLDENNILQQINTFDISLIQDKVYVAVIYWNAVQGKALFVGNERHEASMSWATHYYLHNYEGSRYKSGFDLSGFSINGDGTNNTHSQFIVDSGVFSDEDIVHNMIATSQIPVLYRIGNEWRRKTQDSYPFIGEGQEGFTGSGRACYNQLVMGSYQLTEVSNNHHFLVHLFATNDMDYPVMAILGINEYALVADAREGANTEISTLTGLPFTEFVIIGTVILKTSTSYTNTYKVTAVSTDLGENYVDFRYSTVIRISSGNSDHSLLSNLDQDTHLQYLTTGRADLLYGSLADTNTNTSDISTINISLGTINTTLSGHTTSISTLTSDLSTLTATVGGHTTDISTINGTLTSLDTRVDSLEVNPPTHASTHTDGGSDEIAINGNQITTGNIDLQRLPLLARGDFITSDDGVTNVIRTISAYNRRILGSYPSIGGRTIQYQSLAEFVIPVRESYLYEDFTGGTTAGENNWLPVASGAGAGVSIATQPTQDARRHGVMTMSTGTTTTGRCSYHNGLTNFIYGNNGSLFFDVVCKIDTLSTAAQEYTLEIGLGDNTGATADQTNGIYFKYDRTISTNWLIVTSNGGVRTTTITSIAVTTNWTYLRIFLDQTNSQIIFYVDSATAGTITTNIPVDVTDIMGNLFKIRKTAGTTARTLHVDSVYQWHYKLNVSYGA
jgi:hypothetical protein